MGQEALNDLKGFNLTSGVLHSFFLTLFKNKKLPTNILGTKKINHLCKIGKPHIITRFFKVKVFQTKKKYEFTKKTCS